MKIVSGGRGRLMAAAKIVDKIISLTGKTTPNVLYLGTPTFDADEPFHLQTVSIFVLFHRWNWIISIDYFTLLLYISPLLDFWQD